LAPRRAVAGSIVLRGAKAARLGGRLSSNVRQRFLSVVHFLNTPRRRRLGLALVSPRFGRVRCSRKSSLPRYRAFGPIAALLRRPAFVQLRPQAPGVIAAWQQCPSCCAPGAPQSPARFGSSGRGAGCSQVVAALPNPSLERRPPTAWRLGRGTAKANHRSRGPSATPSGSPQLER
jgi:hypothetical protein